MLCRLCRRVWRMEMYSTLSADDIFQLCMGPGGKYCGRRLVATNLTYYSTCVLQPYLCGWKYLWYVKCGFKGLVIILSVAPTAWRPVALLVPRRYDHAGYQNNIVKYKMIWFANANQLKQNDMETIIRMLAIKSATCNQ